MENFFRWNKKCSEKARKKKQNLTFFLEKDTMLLYIENNIRNERKEK